MSDYKGAALLMDALPEARELLADRGYDADWFRDALLARGITEVVPIVWTVSSGFLACLFPHHAAFNSPSW